MTYEFYMDGEKVTRKTFENAYGKEYVKEILTEAEPFATFDLNGGNDNIFCY